MKTKITSFLILLLMFVHSGNLLAQTITGTASNTGCQNSGIITTSSTGLGTTPQYQLLQSGVVIAPVSGDNTQFTNNPVFSGLSTGTYVVNGRATFGGTVYSSSIINVTDGYTSMAVTTSTKIANCVGGTANLTSTLTNGKAPFTYTIAKQSAPGTALQNSGAITSSNFTFDPLPADNYIVSVTDSCGQTITGSTSITNPTVSVNDIKISTVAYPIRTALSCSDPIKLFVEMGFVYTINGNAVSTADDALFRWKIKFEGQLYGQDTDGDGYADLNGDGFPLTTLTPVMPYTATRDRVTNDLANMRVVLMDMCGNSKEFIVTNYNTIYSDISIKNCGGTAIVRSSIGAGLDCIPLDVTMTNASNPADVHTYQITSPDAQSVNLALTPGATYNLTFRDGEGYTTGLFASSSITQTFSNTSEFNAAQLTYPGAIVSTTNLDYGNLFLTISPYQPTDNLSYTVTSSSNPLVPVGYSYSAPLNSYTGGSSGSLALPSPNPTDPQPYWPKGNYTLQVNTDCGSVSINVTVEGRTASLSGNTISPVCGGFDYLMNGLFDEPTAYQVVILSGPSSVGQFRDLASTTASLPFNGLSYGTYVFGVRIKGGTTNVLTQTITYDANNAIIVDRNRTGGYICTAGATNGILTITAISNSPSPGNSMEYSLSTDGGVNFGPYQTGNTFSGLTNQTYIFRIKDGCGNIITQSVQIGLAASPDATANGQNTPAAICDNATGSIQLDVNIFGALSYLWTGPGIDATNRDIKSPVINYSDLATGTNNFSCTMTLGAPCNSTSVSNLVINLSARPNVVTVNPAAVCEPNTVDLTTSTVTAGSDGGLTYTYFSDAAATTPVGDPAAVSTRGTYYIKGTNANGCYSITPVNVIVNTLPTATINYPEVSYCKINTALPDQTGTAGGTYSSDANLIINASTGEIDLSNSSTGLHTITYTFSDGNCSNTTTADITINALPVATISYPNTTYCNRGKVSSTETGVINGIYSGPPNLAINTVTGEIDLENSLPGTYTVEYTFTDGNCYNTTTTDITINATTLPPTLATVTAECSASPTAPTITDPCAGTITGTTTTVFPIATQGTETVTWTFDYGNGYIKTATQSIIIDDITAPVVPILTDVKAECQVASITPPTTTDNCVGTITGTTTTTFPITTQGTTVVTWTFDDGNGNTS